MKNLRLPTYLTSLLLGFVLVLATPLYAQERDLSRATPSSVGLSEAFRTLLTACVKLLTTATWPASSVH